MVGEATSAAVRQIQGHFQDHGFASVLVLGEHSGTGEQLGKYIVEHHSRTGDGTLLYLTGDKNRDTVPSILAENNIQFRPLQVYETRQRPDFESLLEDAVDSLSSDVTTSTFPSHLPSCISCLPFRFVVGGVFRAIHGKVCDTSRSETPLLQEHITADSHYRSGHYILN